MKTLLLFFHWPEGSVWSNLIASVIWATPTFLHLHHKMSRRADALMEQHLKTTTDIDAIHRHLKIGKHADAPKP